MAVKTYGYIELNQFDLMEKPHRNEWVIQRLEPHVCIKLKDVFQGIAKTQTAPFRFANTIENCHDLLWFISRYPMSISQTDLDTMTRGSQAFLEEQSEAERILSPDYVPTQIILNEPYVPRDYQLRAADFHRLRKKFLLGDDIGLGKTLTGTITFNEKTLPAMVCCQVHLMDHWREKIAEYCNLKTHLIKGTRPYNLPPADVYITAYSRIAGWIDTYQNRYYNSVIFDEIQELRRGESAKHHAAKVIVQNVDYAMGMSATPIYNYGDEIYTIINVIYPHALGSRDAFLREWCTPIGGHWKVNDPQALGTYLREKHLFLRRTRKEVRRELPEVNKVIHTVEYDDAMVKSAEEIARTLALKTVSGSFVERGMAARELDAFVRHQTGISKAKYVAEFVKLLLDGGEKKILLVGWHRDVYDIWLEALKEYNPVMYTGSENALQKNVSKNQFIEGDSRVMIMSLRSGIGLDGLQKVCSCVVYGELDWSPKVHEQVTGRVDRDGQDNEDGVTAFFCVSDFGSDPIMIDILGLKSSQAHGIVDPLVGLTEQLSDDSHLKKLAQRFLDKQNMS